MKELKITETKTIDRLFLELSQFTGARTKNEMQFDQLIYSVERKFPGESRFETALRYIREAENATRVGSEAKLQAMEEAEDELIEKYYPELLCLNP